MTILMNRTKRLLGLTISVTCVISACSTVAPTSKPTLRSIDQQSQENTTTQSQKIEKRSTTEIRNAYKAYLANSEKDDLSRRTALNRLAELEFEVSNQIASEQAESEEQREKLADALQDRKLDQTIELLTTSLTDYPNAKGNDRLLYQLAKALDQRGFYLKSINVLTQLVSQHPNSKYYVEAQFRLAEANFSQGDYLAAENGYTEVLIAPNNHVFYEKAIFKRGWSRFKQSYFQDAIDDYIRAIQYHQFADIEQLSDAEKNLFDEYFRALGLSFSGLGGARPLKEFFDNTPGFKHQYTTYAVLSDLYLKQERFSDAAQVLKQFIEQNPYTKQAAYAQLKTVKVWQQSQFTSKLNQAIELYYLRYNPNNHYWNRVGKNTLAFKKTNQALREYILLVAEYFHSLYQQQPSSVNYSNAKTWYNRYLADFSNYALKDKVYYQYAELLFANKQDQEALRYYELAAYDQDLILDKPSAYATIIITDKLFNQEANKVKRSVILNKLIKYSLLFAQLYRDDPRTFEVISHAIEASYTVGNYQKTVELANLLEFKNANTPVRQKTFYSISLLKAQSYFNLEQFTSAESVYRSILDSGSLNNKQHNEILERMALTIHNYASQLKSNNQLVEASQNYMRIADIAKHSEVAISGLYDAIAIFMTNQSWQQAIKAINQLQSNYPNNKYSKDVTKKLSIAYLKSDQGLKAAEQFEKISSFEKNKEVKIAALWQAAEIYEAKNNYQAAARSYSEYANTYKKPYVQYTEAMFKLVSLYQKMNKPKLKNIWQKRIINADKKQALSDRTNRTNFIVAKTYLELARDNQEQFKKLRLVEPLQANLRKKKKSMQQAITYYGQASNYGIAEMTTESTFAIADIYLNFSQSLLDSERPKHLKGEELEQYDILIEDQAFPFEDKAIEFHEVNLSRIKTGLFNDWVSKSLSELKSLFPAKYARRSKLEGHIDVSYKTSQ